MEYIKNLSFILLLFINNLLFSQFTINGKVIDSQKQPIFGVSVLLKNTQNNSILTYTSTDENGEYKINCDIKGSFLLTFNLLGFNEKVIKINLQNEKIITENVVLVQKSFKLNEVIIREKEIYIKKDTITFNVKKFKDGKEEVLEDLLKKLPGVYVDESGKVKVGNKNIDQLMIDGVNLLDQNYTILSKNMTIDQVSKIEILNNFSDNKLLKDLDEDEKVAINLVLKKNTKKIFGNLSLSHDLKYKDKYFVKGILMNFRKKNKSIFLNNFNNIGVYSFSDISELQKDFVGNDLININNNYHAYKPISLNVLSFGLDQIRTNFNNTKLISLSNITKISSKINFKLFLLFNNDKNKSDVNSIYNYYQSENILTNKENINLNKKNNTYFGKAELNLDLSDNKNIKFITSFTKTNNNAIKNIFFNDVFKKQELNDNYNSFYQSFMFTNKLNTNSALIVNTKFLFEEYPQSFILKNVNYNIIPGLNQNQDIQQNTIDKMFFLDFKSNFVKKIHKHLLTFQLSNEYRKDNFISDIYVLNDNIYNHTGLGNKFDIKINDLYFLTKHKVNIRKFQFAQKLELHRVAYQGVVFSENYFLFPTFSINWKISDFNKLNFIYSYNSLNLNLQDFISNYIFTDYNVFFKDDTKKTYLTKNFVGLNGFFSDFNENFTTRFSFNYNFNYDYKIDKVYINNNYRINERAIFKNKISYNSLVDINYYINPVSVNANLKFRYIHSKYSTVINQKISKINSNYFISSIQFQSGFIGIFNFDIGTKFIVTKFFNDKEYSNYDNKTLFNLFFKFNKKFSFNINDNVYWFDFKNNKNNFFNFLDLGIKYKLIKNKVNLSFKAQNVFNKTKIKIKNITNYGLQTSEYKILPRYLLFRLEFKF